ncbi:MAG: DUF3179 domain-containing protein [Pirellulaceae bacterium]|nr:DUF3179 domain-containing protein [Pirellulaceae bacterium]
MYVRQVDDQILTLRVSGKLWMRSLVMSDVETGTQWSHLLGRAMSGPLKGKELEPIITDMMTWGAWRKEFPATTVLNMPPSSKSYSRDFYADPSKFVFGFEAGGSARALPMEDMIKHPLHAFKIKNASYLATFDHEATATRLFDTIVDGQSLQFVATGDNRMKDTNSGSTWNASTGRAITGPMKGKRLTPKVGIMSFRRAWQNFHPDSKDIEF